MFAISQLKVSGFELIPEVILVGFANCYDFHVDSMDDELFTVVIPAISGFQHDLDDTIHHISVGKKTATKADSYKCCLLWVVW